MQRVSGGRFTFVLVTLKLAGGSSSNPQQEILQNFYFFISACYDFSNFFFPSGKILIVFLNSVFGIFISPKKKKKALSGIMAIHLITHCEILSDRLSRAPFS